MKKDIVYPVLLVIVSLVAGLAIGLVLVRKPRHYYQPRFERREKMDDRRGGKETPIKDMIFNKISRRLDLSEKQEEKLKAILESSRNEAKTIIKTSKEKLIGIKDKTNTQIRAILSKDQQAEFDRMIAEQKDRVENFKERFAHKFRKAGAPGYGVPECKDPPMEPEGYPED